MLRHRHRPSDRRRRRRSTEQRDRGVILPYAAIMLTVLLAFAAFAVDLGLLYSTRRQGQAAVDTGTLAAAFTSGAANPLDGESQLVDDVIGFTHDDVLDAPSAAEWQAMFASCTDSTKPAEYTHSASKAGTTYDCISFNGPVGARDQLRVRLPSLDMDTSFAKLVGVDTFSTTAIAEVRVITGRIPTGGTLPYGIPAASASSTSVCIQRDSNNGYCLGNNSPGNAGRLDFTIFGADVASQQCGNAHPDEKTAINLAAGLDHVLTEANPETATAIIDSNVCSGSQTGDPNSSYPQTGNADGPLTEGLLAAEVCSAITCNSPLSGRLRQLIDGAGGITYDSSLTVQVTDVVADDTPLWLFMDQGLTAGTNGDDDDDDQVPVACVPDLYTSSYANLTALVDWLDLNQGLDPTEAAAAAAYLSGQPWWSFGSDNGREDLLRMCFDDYKAGQLYPAGPTVSGGYATDIFRRNSDAASESGEIFDIEHSPRFGWLPVVWTFPNGTSTPAKFKEFRPIWIQTLYWKCNAPGGTPRCSAVHKPGQANGQGSSDIPASRASARLDAIDALNFPYEMLPQGVLDNEQGSVSDADTELIR